MWSSQVRLSSTDSEAGCRHFCVFNRIGENWLCFFIFCSSARPRAGSRKVALLFLILLTVLCLGSGMHLRYGNYASSRTAYFRGGLQWSPPAIPYQLAKSLASHDSPVRAWTIRDFSLISIAIGKSR